MVTDEGNKLTSGHSEVAELDKIKILENVKTHFLHHPQHIKQWKIKETDNYVDSISNVISSCIA